MPYHSTLTSLYLHHSSDQQTALFYGITICHLNKRYVPSDVLSNILQRSIVPYIYCGHVMFKTVTAIDTMFGGMFICSLRGQWLH